MALWRKDIKSDLSITLIHDASSSMAREKQIWDAIVSPTITPQIIGYDVRTMQLPIGVTETRAEDSKIWAS